MILCVQLEKCFSCDGRADDLEYWQRKLLFSSAGIVFPISVAFMIVVPLEQRPFLRVVMSTIAAVSCLTLLAIFCKVHLSNHVTTGLLYVVGIIGMLLDMEARTMGIFLWPFVLIVLDSLLMLRVGKKRVMMFVCLMLCWVSLLAVEQAVRFGLFDMPGLLPQEERRRIMEKRSVCAKLPCAMGAFNEIVDVMPVFAVVIVNYITTDGFAQQVRKEQAVMQRTISTVQEVSRLLAKYDVEGVARMLSEQQRELPALMHETLKQMEANLRNYRPYLPAALFEERDHPSTARLSPAPPGLESGVATVVFTDIRSSTAIWECAPEGMRLGLQIHNAVLREEMHQYGGYEVKTIGDAFMIAFETTCEGMNFALRTHESLRRAAWPLSLLEEAPICANQGPLWGGLTVRIGINTGPVTVERNALTGRIDYFGHTVNVASRLEGSCTPGAVTVLSDLWMSECQSCNAAVGATQALELKGVADTVFVVSVWPVSLAGRETSPLREGVLTENTSFMTYASSSSAFFTPYLEPTGIPATVGVMELADTSAPLRVVSMGLSALTAQLDQSGGMLVALLGNCVCAGWNLTRCAPAHMENAVRFAQRAQRAKISNGTGLVSGLIRHGDVGSRTQRFVTVIGDPVRRSWALCEAAVRGGGLCLYEPPSDVEMPSALNHMLEPDAKCKGLYKVVNVSRDNTG